MDLFHKYHTCIEWNFQTFYQVERDQQPFYFRSKRNGPMSEPIPDVFTSICFDDPDTGEQLFWHPSGVNSSMVLDRIVKGN